MSSALIIALRTVAIAIITSVATILLEEFDDSNNQG